MSLPNPKSKRISDTRLALLEKEKGQYTQPAKAVDKDTPEVPVQKKGK